MCPQVSFGFPQDSILVINFRCGMGFKPHFRVRLICLSMQSVPESPRACLPQTGCSINTFDCATFRRTSYMLDIVSLMHGVFVVSLLRLLIPL